MKIETKNTYKINSFTVPRKKPNVSDFILPAVQAKPLKSIYDKGSYQISFGENLIDDYIYDKSLVKHINEAKVLNPKAVEDYFRALGIPCEFRNGTDKAKKVVAYCSFNAAEMLRQINMVLPTKITMGEMGNPDILAVCYYLPDIQNNIPIRTVEFNTEYDWDNHMETLRENNKKNGGHFSSGHFIQTFLHEFAHNIHYHHLYSKFGVPVPNQGYVYNPDVSRILKALNMPVYDSNTGKAINNKYVTKEAREAMKKSSGYGSTLLPETFAEEFARAFINCMDYMSLRLKKNPLPIITSTPALNQVLYETWEGLIDDNQGIIK